MGDRGPNRFVPRPRQGPRRRALGGSLGRRDELAGARQHGYRYRGTPHALEELPARETTDGPGGAGGRSFGFGFGDLAGLLQRLHDPPGVRGTQESAQVSSQPPAGPRSDLRSPYLEEGWNQGSVLAQSLLAPLLDLRLVEAKDLELARQPLPDPPGQLSAGGTPTVEAQHQPLARSLPTR